MTLPRISQPSSRSARSTTIKILQPLEGGQESKFTQFTLVFFSSPTPMLSLSVPLYLFLCHKQTHTKKENILDCDLLTGSALSVRTPPSPNPATVLVKLTPFILKKEKKDKIHAARATSPIFMSDFLLFFSFKGPDNVHSSGNLHHTKHVNTMWTDASNCDQTCRVRRCRRGSDVILF